MDMMEEDDMEMGIAMPSPPLENHTEKVSLYMVGRTSL